MIKDKNDLFKTYILVEHIYKNTNVIYINKGKTYLPATIVDISELIGISIRRAKEYMKRMKDMGIIAEMVLEIQEERYTSFIFNPIYVNSCRYISNDMYLLFKPYLDKHFPLWIKQKYFIKNHGHEPKSLPPEYM